MPKPLALAGGRRGTALVLLSGWCALGLARPAVAQQTTIALEPAWSEIHFTLGATLHSVHGTFKLNRGELEVDPATGKADGAIVVDATSGSSDNSSRDQKMHKEVLESARYAEIAFWPKLISPAESGPSLAESLEKKGTSAWQAVGTFRLHGVDHPLTMALSLQNDGAGSVEIRGKFSVPYVQWGLKNPSNLLLHVSDTVEIEIHSRGKLLPGGRRFPENP